MIIYVFFFSSRRRHTRWPRDWSSDVCSSDLKNYELQNLLNLIDRKITNKELKTTLFNELKSKQNKIEQLEQERSEERRVGKESRFRRRGGPLKKENIDSIAEGLAI